MGNEEAKTPEEIEEERLEELERPIRRAGHLFFLSVALIMITPIAISVFQGVCNDRAFDPLTGSAVSRSEEGVDCRNEAGTLMYLAGQVGQRDTRWEQRYRQWLVRCRQEHPDLLDLLNQSRERMHRAGQVPEVAGEGPAREGEAVSD
jgi:hypothetical protein